MPTSPLEYEGTLDCGELVDTPSVTQESPLMEFPLVAPMDRLEEVVEHTTIDEEYRSMKEL